MLQRHNTRQPEATSVLVEAVAPGAEPAHQARRRELARVHCLYGRVQRRLYREPRDRVRQLACPPKMETVDGAWMGREAILEFVQGSAAKALGAAYRRLDDYALRARMAAPPYLFVSRVLSTDARLGALGSASLSWEYDIPTDTPFSENGLISGVLVGESTQAGILLLALMGVDLVNQECSS